MAVLNVIFWYLMHSSLVDWYQCFGGIFREVGGGDSFLSKYTSHLQVTVFNIYPVGTSHLRGVSLSLDQSLCLSIHQ
jgi:hypothetical protein